MFLLSFFQASHVGMGTGKRQGAMVRLCGKSGSKSRGFGDWGVNGSSLWGGAYSFVVLEGIGTYQQTGRYGWGGSTDKFELSHRKVYSRVCGMGRKSGEAKTVGYFSSGDDFGSGICPTLQTALGIGNIALCRKRRSARKSGAFASAQG